MTIQELTLSDQWASVEHGHVTVKDLGGTVYYDGGDMQVMEYECFVTDDDFPAWAKRQILMCHHNIGDSGIEDYEDEVVITII